MTKAYESSFAIEHGQQKDIGKHSRIHISGVAGDSGHHRHFGGPIVPGFK
jgi:hypothetical protein